MFRKCRDRFRSWRYPNAAFLVCVSLVFALPIPVRAATLNVAQGDPECSDVSGEPFCTIGAAVASAMDGDEIEVGAGTYVETITVSPMITIRGAEVGATTVDGAGQGPVFDLVGDVALERLTITGGSQMIFGGGGGIRSSGQAQVTDCLVTGNTGAGGGGMKQEGGTLQLLRTTVSNNTSDATNVAGGAGIWTEAGDLTIIDSRIADNHNLHPGSPGGGLKVDGGNALLVRTTVEGNTSQNNYGGIITEADLLTLIESTVSDNEAANTNGGIGSTSGNITLINTTVSGNRAGVSAGVSSPGQLILRNVTIFGNESFNSGGTGVFFGGESMVSNSILAGNTSPSGPSDCSGTLDSHGYNLIQSVNCTIIGDQTGNVLGVDPFLLPLADNGGPTQTHSLADNSPAREAGNPEPPDSVSDACEPTDQRGIERPQDGDSDGFAVCDIGAFELAPLIFGDGFESGDISAWSLAVGAR